MTPLDLAKISLETIALFLFLITAAITVEDNGVDLGLQRGANEMERIIIRYVDNFIVNTE